MDDPVRCSKLSRCTIYETWRYPGIYLLSKKKAIVLTNFISYFSYLLNLFLYCDFDSHLLSGLVSSRLKALTLSPISWLRVTIQYTCDWKSRVRLAFPSLHWKSTCHHHHHQSQSIFDTVRTGRKVDLSQLTVYGRAAISVDISHYLSIYLSAAKAPRTTSRHT